MKKIKGQKKEVRGVWLDYNFLNYTKSHTEVLLLSIISALDNDYGCYASNESLGKYIRRHKNQVSALISRMKNKGFISVSLDNKEHLNSKRIIRINKRLFSNLIIDHKQFCSSHVIQSNDQYSNHRIMNKKSIDRELTNFSYLELNFKNDLEIIIMKFNLSSDQLRYCVNAFNDKEIRRLNCTHFENFISNWKQNIKKNHNPSIPGFQFKRIG